jgi:hypothetical protein
MICVLTTKKEQKKTGLAVEIGWKGKGIGN